MNSEIVKEYREARANGTAAKLDRLFSDSELEDLRELFEGH